MPNAAIIAEAHPEGTRLRDFPFVDLYLGDGYSEVKVQPGTHAARAPLPDRLTPDAARIREKAAQIEKTHGDPEFAILHDDVMYRATVLYDLRAAPIYFLRRIDATIRDARQLGLPAEVLSFVLSGATHGLILIAGETAAGKTTTAASILSARLAANGGFGVAVEDPPETTLDGLHGQGRCFQIPATRRNGYYSEQLRSALRTGVGNLLIGEIRDRETAAEAIAHSTNGMAVISTIHAQDPTDAISRLLAYAGVGDMAKPQAILSSGIACVIHQKLTRAGNAVRVSFRTLLVTPPDDGAIRATIRDNVLDELLQITDRQARRLLWAANTNK